MSLLARLNLNYLRIFLLVYRTKSMTLAAKQLHLTQSGVSQQIKSLEDTLGITLFDRINRKIIPTSEADLLYAECSRRLDDLESTLRQIAKQDGELLGRVKIGVSPSLQYKPLVHWLGEFGREHPKLKFEIRTGMAAEISRWFEDGNIDFALVDAFVNEPNLDYEEIATDPYILIAHQELLAREPEALQNFESLIRLPFVQYTEAGELLNAWFKKNWGRLPKDLFYRSRALDVASAREFVEAGLGAGLLPESIASEVLARNPLIKALTFKAPVSNRLRIASLQKRTMGLSAKLCAQWLIDRFERSQTQV